ncbi:UDP-3-O-(3-hydroxymyristoyl)glucosamine N-acyltransferase [Membranihabitans maritimus]|uniref:UDP-3-O-(3-hydroxymyristoyl)glucosamine N-acyltransferase n=1 Tax=Membranihabitans maritimus TaxID=2904244 RepID=UPI001F01AD82|nr:UDP-3-O-(3-hydroxymyristoyl)glucosamine N-acyltransferase [Membranihabitans maritimus]
MEAKINQIAELINAEVQGNGEGVITHPGKIEDAGPGAITFFSNAKYEEYLYQTQATAIIVGKDFNPRKPVPTTLLKVENVYLALSILFEFFDENKVKIKGISPLASIHEGVEVPDSVYIGPFVHIEKGVMIGENCEIQSHVYIGTNVQIGNGVRIFPGVKVHADCRIGNAVTLHANAVIGSDGFGFARDSDGNYRKIPQIGNVVLKDNVDIGANTVVDRASMGSTIIEEGVKLDNLVQIAHNVVIGKNTVIAAQAGIAGSSQLGSNNQLGGQAGIAGHIKIGSENLISGQSGVMSDLGDNNRVFGSPAYSHLQFFKAFTVTKKLPEIEKRLAQLEKKVKNDTK